MKLSIGTISTLLAIAVTAVVILAAGLITVHNSTYNCQQAELLKKNLYDIVNTGSKRLPKIQYYKQHPDELKNAIADNKATLRALSPASCKGFFGN